MPRRCALTEAQLDALFALPTTEADLIRHWTLDGADLAAVDRRRGASNQLGYALQLCAFRYPGRLLRPGEAIPEPALRFVAEQIHVGADALAAYAARRQTRQEQLDDLREAFGFCMYAPGHGRDMLAWLLPVALATTNALAITAALMDELRRRRIVAPGPSIVERLVAAVLVVAERHVAGQLTRNLSPAQTEALDALLAPKEGTPLSILGWARQPPGGARPQGPCPCRRAVDLLAGCRPRSRLRRGRASGAAAEAGPRGRALHRPAPAGAVAAPPPGHPGCDRAGHHGPPDRRRGGPV